MKGFIELVDFQGRTGFIRANSIVAIATSTEALVQGAPLVRTIIELEGRGSYYYTPETTYEVGRKLEEALTDRQL